MAGLLEKKMLADDEEAMPPEAPPDESAMPADESDDEEDDDNDNEDDNDSGSNVSPAEQRDFDVFVANCMNAIYDRKSVGPIIERLGAGDDPVASLAETTVMIVDRVVGSAKQAGKKIDGDVLLQGGSAVLEDLAELADKAGVHDFSEQEIESALYQAVDQYRVLAQKRGDIDPAQAQSDLQAMNETSNAGDLAEAAKQFSSRQPPPAPPDQAQAAPPTAERGLMSKGAM